MFKSHTGATFLLTLEQCCVVKEFSLTSKKTPEEGRATLRALMVEAWGPAAVAAAEAADNPHVDEASDELLEELDALAAALEGKNALPMDLSPSVFTHELASALQFFVLTPKAERLGLSDTVGAWVEGIMRPLLPGGIYSDDGVLARCMGPAEDFMVVGNTEVGLVFEKGHPAAGAGRDISAHATPTPVLAHTGVARAAAALPAGS